MENAASSRASTVTLLLTTFDRAVLAVVAVLVVIKSAHRDLTLQCRFRITLALGKDI